MGEIHACDDFVGYEVRGYPRSALKGLRDPILDPGDHKGHYSARDIMLLREWKAAMKGDDKALRSAIDRISRRSSQELKDARKRPFQVIRTGEQVEWPTLVPVLELLGLAESKLADREHYRYDEGCERAILQDWVLQAAYAKFKIKPFYKRAIQQWIEDGCLQKIRQLWHWN